MAKHMTTEEAQRQGLPNSRLFLNFHLLYHDERNRDLGVVQLNYEAAKAFHDTIMIKDRGKLADEQKAINECLASGQLPSHIGETKQKEIFYINYEHLKIALGLELHLKARLIAKDYIVHAIINNNKKHPTYKQLGV